MGSLVQDPGPTQRIYVHQLNLTSGDILRRQREKEMIAQEKAKLEEMKEIKRRQKEEERKRDMEMLLSYNPWGKPGGGAPKNIVKRTKIDDVTNSSGTNQEVDPFNEKFGRPGAGAPNRTNSGRIQTQLIGDPDIRFQDTQLVRRSIENQLRYKNEDKKNYKGNLDNLVRQKLSLQEKEKEWERKKFEEMRELYPFGRKQNGGAYVSQTVPRRRRPVVKEDFDPWGKGFGNAARDSQGNVNRHKFAPSAEEGIPDPTPSEELGMTLNIGRIRGGDGAPHVTESGHVKARLHNTLNNINAMGPHVKELSKSNGFSYEPWGKPGAGAPFQREDGKSFEERMGWSLTGHPKKRSKDAKEEYMKVLRQEIEERRRREEQERSMAKEGGQELASVIRASVGGRPKKDPVTGEIARNARQATDVTTQTLDIRRVKSQESLAYQSELQRQAAERQQLRQKQKELERAQSEQHMYTWESFWGRPGHGAPRDPQNHKKENIENLLLKPKQETQPYVKHYVTEMVPSKHKNRYEYPTENGPIIKKDYEFRTPWPAEA